MILWILLLFEITSIAIYIVMSTQNAFEKILPKWKGEWDDRAMDSKKEGGEKVIHAAVFVVGMVFGAAATIAISLCVVQSDED